MLTRLPSETSEWEEVPVSGADGPVSAAEDPSHKAGSGDEGSWLHRFVLDKLRVFLQPSILLLLLGASMRHTGQLWDDLGTGWNVTGSICGVDGWNAPSLTGVLFLPSAAGFCWSTNTQLYFQTYYPTADLGLWLSWVSIVGGSIGVTVGQ